MTPKQAILAEASRIQLEDFVSTELNGLVDYRTGEILDELVYATSDYQPDTHAHLPCFDEVRSANQLAHFMDHIDRRTLVTVNDSRRLYDLDKGNHHLHGRPPVFTNLQYTRLNQLVSRLDYANSIITTPAELARALRTQRNNVYRYLSSLGHLVHVFGQRDGMARGTLRIDLSPAYGFRYPKADLGPARQDAIEVWYRALLQ